MWVLLDWKNNLMTCAWLQIVGWLNEAKVSCILHHQGVQLILAYSWAGPVILAAGEGRGGMFLFYFSTLIHFPFNPVPLFHHFSLSLRDDTKWPTRVDASLNPNSINQPEKLGIRKIFFLFLHENMLWVLLRSASAEKHMLWVFIRSTLPRHF